MGHTWIPRHRTGPLGHLVFRYGCYVLSETCPSANSQFLKALSQSGLNGTQQLACALLLALPQLFCDWFTATVRMTNTPKCLFFPDHLIQTAMAFDLVVLVMSVAGLLRAGGTQGSDLWKLLFRDGIAYFVVAFVGNAVASVSILSYGGSSPS